MAYVDIFEPTSAVLGVHGNIKIEGKRGDVLTLFDVTEEFGNQLYAVARDIRWAQFGQTRNDCTGHTTEVCECGLEFGCLGCVSTTPKSIARRTQGFVNVPERSSRVTLLATRNARRS